MANALHMETESVYACATRLRTECDEIRSQAQLLAASARSVEWYGPARDDFQYEMEQIAIALAKLADEGDVLATRVQAEVNEWQQTDSYYVQQFLQVIIPNVIKGKLA